MAETLHFRRYYGSGLLTLKSPNKMEVLFRIGFTQPSIAFQASLLG